MLIGVIFFRFLRARIFMLPESVEKQKRDDVQLCHGGNHDIYWLRAEILREKADARLIEI